MLKYLLTIVIMLAVLITAALNYHFILLDDDPIDVKVLKKFEMTLDSTFIDARGTNRYKLFLNPALLKAGLKDILKSQDPEGDKKKPN